MDINNYIIGYVCSNPACRSISKNKADTCHVCGSKGIKPVYDYFSLFDISPNFTQSDLAKAYKKLSMKYHPDINNGGKDVFLVVSEGYQVLKDDKTKNDYIHIYNKIKRGDFSAERESPYMNSQYAYHSRRWSESDFEDIFRNFHNFSKKNYNLRRASSTAGTLGGLVGLIFGAFAIPGIGAFPGFIIGYFVGRTNPSLGPVFLALLNFVVIIVSVLVVGTILLFGGLSFPIIFIWGLIVYFFYTNRKKWAKVFQNKE